MPKTATKASKSVARPRVTSSPTKVNPLFRYNNAGDFGDAKPPLQNGSQHKKSRQPPPEFLNVNVRKRQKPFQPVIKPETKLVLFEISDATDFEQMKYLFWVKDKIKLYRAMFRQYSAANVRGKNADTFDTRSKQSNLISLGALNSFLADF